MKEAKKLDVKVGKKALRTVPESDLRQVSGGEASGNPKCSQSPPPCAI